jgi:RNA polymerase sigma-70 factor (ECF subfamily)
LRDLISIAEIRAGEEHSFTTVFNLHYPKVYHYFLRKTRTQQTACELAQLTFIKLWEFRHTLSEEHSFDTQLFQIAATTHVDYLRREHTQRKKALAMVRDADAEDMQAAAAMVFETSDYLHSLTSTLPPVRKKVFILSRVHGYSYKEIAGQLSISIKTVEDHMVKALRHIRSIASHLFILFLLVLAGLPY